MLAEGVRISEADAEDAPAAPVGLLGAVATSGSAVAGASSEDVGFLHSEEADDSELGVGPAASSGLLDEMFLEILV